MANKILTPTTLWNDFDTTLPPSCTVLEETQRDGICLQRIRFFGRAVGNERVNIYAVFGFPAGKDNLPALLILPDARLTCDEALVQKFANRGYAVLMPDYGGKREDGKEFTIYPEAVSYANVLTAGRHIDFADETAKETSWYEWVAAARYCIVYLKTLSFIGKIGAIGLRAGGDVVWQLAATCSDLSCAIPVCAGGWRAYRGIYKFGEATELKMDDERYRFLAGVDSQAYAQNAKCPVLMLCSTNDERFDADRAFDTFARINPEMEKTFYFTARYNGRIGNTALNDLYLFVDKYLKGREVFIPSPVEISVEEADGELLAHINFDKNGEVKACDVYMAEDSLDSALRDWSKCAFKKEENDHEQYFYLNAYKNSSRVFVFARARYSCGFAVSSKIAVKRLEKTYLNSSSESRILYSGDSASNSFTFDRFDRNVLADCFLDNSIPPVKIKQGPFGIYGIGSDYGLKLFRLGDKRYKPADGALLKFDVYAPAAASMQIRIEVIRGGAKENYFCECKMMGGERWENKILSAKDFKSEINKPLAQINEGQVIAFNSESEFYINNLIWL